MENLTHFSKHFIQRFVVHWELMFSIILYTEADMTNRSLSFHALIKPERGPHMKTIQSRYLNREFEFEPATIQRNSGPATIIPHNVLWDIIHNQIFNDQGISYDYTPIKVSKEHCFIQCTLRDVKGRLVHEFGESVAETLVTPIAKNIPGTMASIRAFDRTAIRYLDFDCAGKIYSDQEIPESEIAKALAEQKTSGQKKQKSAKKLDPVILPEPQEETPPVTVKPSEPQNVIPSAGDGIAEPQKESSLVAEEIPASVSAVASASVDPPVVEDDVFREIVPTTWQNDNLKKSVLEAMETHSEIIIFDTETTGLKPADDRILELSAQKFAIQGENLTMVDELHTYIKPPFAIDPKITELNGITNEFLADKPVEEEAFVEIFTFFGEQPQILCAYNTPFDVRFLQALYKRQEKSLMPKYQIDVLAMARDLVKSAPNYQLETIAGVYGLAGEEFHTASFDTDITVKLFELFYGEYAKETAATDSAAVSGKIRPVIQSVSSFNKSNTLRRIYVNTDHGTVYYDCVKHQWASKDAKLDTLDMDYLEKEAWKLTGTVDQKSFENFKEKWSAAA